MSLNVEKCLQAWTNSLRQMNAKADIVFFGDSLTYYGDFSTVFPDKVVCNLGLRGDTIQGMIDRVEQVSMLEPKIVYLMAGINDIASSSFDDFECNYERLIVHIKRMLPDSKLIIQSLLPVDDENFTISCNNQQIYECNMRLQRIAYKMQLQYLDVYSVYECNRVLPNDCTNDGIHLRPEKYYKWYNLLKRPI